MNEECIYECIDIGQNKYRYMHETFDEMFTGPWTFKINNVMIVNQPKWQLLMVAAIG